MASAPPRDDGAAVARRRICNSSTKFVLISGAARGTSSIEFNSTLLEHCPCVLLLSKNFDFDDNRPLQPS